MVELHSQDPMIIRLVTEACSGECELQVYRTDYKQLPRRFDLCATSGQLSPGVERFSAAHGAMTIVLPEGGQYLADKGKAGHVSVLGSDYRRVKY
jgi:hypothetical protein